MTHPRSWRRGTAKLKQLRKRDTRRCPRLEQERQRHFHLTFSLGTFNFRVLTHMLKPPCGRDHAEKDVPEGSAPTQPSTQEPAPSCATEDPSDDSSPTTVCQELPVMCIQLTSNHEIIINYYLLLLIKLLISERFVTRQLVTTCVRVDVPGCVCTVHMCTQCTCMMAQESRGSRSTCVSTPLPLCVHAHTLMQLHGHMHTGVSLSHQAEQAPVSARPPLGLPLCVHVHVLLAKEPDRGLTRYGGG